MELLLGAIAEANGCHFRLWAPNAERVRVLLQSGARWSQTNPTESHQLTINGDGYWNGFIDGVEPGRLYRDEITNEEYTFQRLDPAGRDMIHSQLTRNHPASENASIVTCTEFDWSPFKTPRFDQFNIYQLHCGSFAGRGDEFPVDVAGFKQIVRCPNKLVQSYEVTG